jgi:hypothetical protein
VPIEYRGQLNHRSLCLGPQKSSFGDHKIVHKKRKRKKKQKEKEKKKKETKKEKKKQKEKNKK